MKRLWAFSALAVLLFTACPAQSQDGLSVVPITIPSYTPMETAIVLRGDSVTTARLVLGYDPSVLRIYGFESRAALLDTVFFDSASVTIALADTTPLTGLLGMLKIEAVIEKDWKTTLHWQHVILDSIQVPLHDGTVTIRPHSIPDLNRDGQVSWDDAEYLFRIVAADLPSTIEQLYPPWWLHRANIHKDMTTTGMPRIDLLDVVMLLRTF